MRRSGAFARAVEEYQAAYDLVAVGWPNTAAAPDDAPAWVYDTAQPGYANTGHLFGDRLTPADRTAVLEYLKTL